MRRMENYERHEVIDQPTPRPFEDVVPEDLMVIRVNDGSKIRNLLTPVFSRLAEEGPRAKVAFVGRGKSAPAKTVTCVEIVRRREPSLHQIARLAYHVVEECWKPLVPESGLDNLTVTRQIPTISVLLSKDPLDPSLPGYQLPGPFLGRWPESEEQGKTGMTTGSVEKKSKWKGPFRGHIRKGRAKETRGGGMDGPQRGRGITSSEGRLRSHRGRGYSGPGHRATFPSGGSGVAKV
uniref:ribonuclease P protein subunit p25-like protein n=1 Tax=Myxine glutinosa TaxID=7769 RepID=UPI00358FB261